MSFVSPSFASGDNGVTVLFGERFAQSEQFDNIFREGMALVDRTADYLDDHGRTESRSLKPPLSVVYATESMRLTTRLLELASWLLVQRGLRDGEISREEAAKKRGELSLRTAGRPQSIKHFDQLPDGLRQLIQESVSLMDRIVLIDEGMRHLDDEPAPNRPTANPVSSAIASLQAAFASRH